MRMRRLLVLIVGALLMLATATTALAAPITCPPGQSPSHTDSGEWLCLNNGGHTDQSGETKNPND